MSSVKEVGYINHHHHACRWCNKKRISQETTAAKRRLSSARAAPVADLQIVQLRLELLDSTVRHLQVLVEAIALRDELHRHNAISKF